MVPFPRSSAAISPTAHYTGYVWARNGLAPAGFATTEGRLMYAVTEPAMLVSRVLGGPTFEDLLLARHACIDELLDAAVAEGRVEQVVEVAAGLSPRGRRFAARYADRGLTYVEGDLPGMARRKRALLERVGTGGGDLRVVELDALRSDDAPGSLAHLVSGLDRGRGLAIITEGLLNYFDAATVEGMWQRFATAIASSGGGTYLSDLIVRSDATGAGPVADTARAALSLLVGWRIHFHYRDAEEAAARLTAAGLREPRLHRPSPSAPVHVIEVTV